MSSRRGTSALVQVGRWKSPDGKDKERGLVPEKILGKEVGIGAFRRNDTPSERTIGRLGGPRTRQSKFEGITQTTMSILVNRSNY